MQRNFDFGSEQRAPTQNVYEVIEPETTSEPMASSVPQSDNEIESVLESIKLSKYLKQFMDSGIFSIDQLCSLSDSDI